MIWCDICCSIVHSRLTYPSLSVWNWMAMCKGQLWRDIWCAFVWILFARSVHALGGGRFSCHGFCRRLHNCWKWSCLQLLRSAVKASIWPLLVGSGDDGICVSFPSWRRRLWRTFLVAYVLSKVGWYRWLLRYIIGRYFDRLRWFFSSTYFSLCV